MNSNAECPICMEPVCASRNCIITECGHSFHSNCLFKHTAMNGFYCPYCRTSMADVPEDEEEYEDVLNKELNWPINYNIMYRSFFFKWLSFLYMYDSFYHCLAQTQCYVLLSKERFNLPHSKCNHLDCSSYQI